jgi:putative membrane protein
VSDNCPGTDLFEVNGMHYWFAGGHVIWMLISWLVGIGLLIGLVWWIVSAFAGRIPRRDSPESILRRRYAAGEINTEEFEQRLAALRKTKDVA